MDAKEILRKQDPDYVRRLESTGQSERDWLTPSQGLPHGWYGLMATCHELHVLASMAQAAAAGLTPLPYLQEDLSPADIGQLSAHSGRSWFVHIKALAERTKDVIRQTTKVYISDSTAADKVAQRHTKAVRDCVEDHGVQFERQGTIRELRNEFAHGNKPSWASGITKGDDGHEYLWEALIARDVTPRRMVDGFLSTIGQETIAGRYSSAVADTKDVFDRLGRILHELEEDIATPTG